VFSRVRVKVKETQCTNNLHQIGQALQLYKDNWDKYPIVIDTIVSQVGNNPVLVRTLFPQYLKSEEALHCPLATYADVDANVNFQDPTNANKLTSLNPEQAVKRWPNPNGSPLVVCVNQAGRARALESQCFQGEQSFPVQFPLRDSYDGGLVPNKNGNAYELHYALDWTEMPPGINDQPRQLKYRTPPADTVVTWCMNHVEIGADGVPHGNVLVLFKDGRVKTLSGEKFYRWGQDLNTFLARP